jgi:putative tryptophan/tyrosine transport system substrate-binding protein
VRHKVDVLVTSTDVAVAAAKRETRTIPIVMAFSTDPVGTGFVTSLAHPGGNITGLSNISAGLAGKRVELLKEAIPGLSRVAYLWNPDVRGNLFDYKETESAACSLRLNPVMFASRTEFVGLALKKRLPSIYAVREYVSLGGLLSYGPSLPAMYRRAATFVDKVLKGAKPADLPVEQPTKFELIVNL